ncbi:hypothetical protein B6N31_08265 [Dickeya fangzhongdai]|nr:hypothetical protein B6N31_08265 [Dickeya fangzhongdai]
MVSDGLRTYPNRAILLAILALGGARNPHVLRVRSGLLAALARWAGPIALSVQHALHVVSALPCPN